MSARDVSLSNRKLSSPQLAGKWLRAPVRAGGADAASRTPGGRRRWLGSTISTCSSNDSGS
jgi:hypothetical protein